MSDTSKFEGALLCPYCGDTVPSLTPIETGMRLRLTQSGQINPVPDAVCTGCLQMMTKMATAGATLKAENAAKESNKLVLWKSRVQLVKQAQAFLAEKNYSEAAVTYEKYLRILEIVYDAKPGELHPETFQAETRAQEITVTSSVYWDLLRIYDSNDRYKDRQMKSAERLAEFVRYSPIFAQIMRKAESQARSAKNPEAFRHFLKLAQSKRPRCFIATAAFENDFAPTVLTLCRFRDQRLKKTVAGRAFVIFYYRFSPRLATLLDRYPRLKPATRTALRWIAALIAA